MPQEQTDNATEQNQTAPTAPTEAPATEPTEPPALAPVAEPTPSTAPAAEPIIPQEPEPAEPPAPNPPAEPLPPSSPEPPPSAGPSAAAETPADTAEPAPAPPAPPQGQESFIQQLLIRARDRIQFRKRAKLEKIAAAAREQGSIANDDVQKLLRVSDATATRYLARLVRDGQLVRVGHPRNASYRPAA